MKVTERLETYLQNSGVSFQIQRHPVAYTAQEIAASEHVSGKLLAKVVMVMADERLAMLVLPAPYTVNLAKAAEAFGCSKVRLAHEEEFAGAFPGCEVGAMPPFGKLFDMPTFVDRSLTLDDTIYFTGGSHRLTMSMRYRDFARLVDPIIVDVANEPAMAMA